MKSLNQKLDRIVKKTETATIEEYEEFYNSAFKNKEPAPGFIWTNDEYFKRRRIMTFGKLMVGIVVLVMLCVALYWGVIGFVGVKAFKYVEQHGVKGVVEKVWNGSGDTTQLK